MLWLWLWCCCLVGQSGAFQWRGALINGTQIDTLGLIAASLSMVEAVSRTAVNLQVDEVVEFGKDSIVLRLTVWWLCASPRCHNVVGNAKTSYFLYVMISTGFLVIVICVRGLGCHLFAKCFLGHGVFVRLRIDADDDFVFLRKQFLK